MEIEEENGNERHFPEGADKEELEKLIAQGIYLVGLDT